MARDINRDPDLEWLDNVQRAGLVVAPGLLKELGLSPLHQTSADTGLAAELLEPDTSKPAIADPWTFVERVLNWEARHVAGAPGGPVIPDELFIALPEHATTLKPTWAVAELGDGGPRWQLLVRIEAAGVDPDVRGALDGWEATPQQRFERLLRDTGVFAGLMFTDNSLRLIYSPRGETSGYLTFPLLPLGTVAGRPMLGGLKLLLDRSSLFTAADSHRLPALLKKSRDAQASVSTALAEQVLGALHELLRGLDNADSAMIRGLAASNSGHLYEGLLAVLMRLVFVLYAEDRDLLPSRQDARAREIYESSYSLRGLHAKLADDAAQYPDTMDERRGGWGRLLALFRLIHRGHGTGFVQGRGGKLFDPDEYPFLEGRKSPDEAPRVLIVSDGCLIRILESLVTIKLRGEERERISYRALDVEQIGSVYETVMGFTVEVVTGPVIAIKGGKHNRTPVFVSLEEVLVTKGKARIRALKGAGRGQFTGAQKKAIEASTSVAELATALDAIVDERASPQHVIAPAGVPILQPTNERRRTGSHYTPRSLTAPIVMHALEPAFNRLGANATSEQVLDLKICDPAMGSGAFLVEACRAIGERLVAAWARWPDTRPTIPADEDEELHARRLVAQRCLYGVDKNPRAVDLARLSLWLATLARDHEFTFLDHALKCGDSLVGLTRKQITSLHWDGDGGLSLFGTLVKERFEAAVNGRMEIREAPDDVRRAIQEVRYRKIEDRLDHIRLIGDAIVAAFFSADKPQKRERNRQEIESWSNGPVSKLWPKLEELAESLRRGPHAIEPFHWEIEFPEVFARENVGFDAIVGNPPFLGGRKISGELGDSYLAWLMISNEKSHGNADLVAHFFRRTFRLIRNGGCLGLISTNTIRQGDTRSSGLAPILAAGGKIARATRRLRWPGEAAVVVSVVHVDLGCKRTPVLDGKEVERISSYLLNGELDEAPEPLASNSRKCFQGVIVLGSGFTFDNKAFEKGTAPSLADMDRVIALNKRNQERILPYIGGEEINNDPRQRNHRFVIDFGMLPMRYHGEPAWESLQADQRQKLIKEGFVDSGHSGPTVDDWPELVSVLDTYAKGERARSKNKDVRAYPWWRHWRPRPDLALALRGLQEVLVTNCGAAPHLAFCVVPTGSAFAHTLAVSPLQGRAAFAILQSRTHETWARFFSSSMKDDLRYTPSDCFRTYPFPSYFETDAALEAVGKAYHAFRAEMMVDRNEGLTKTYNHFHARAKNTPDIMQLRVLHAQMDVTVLRAYGWGDLAERAASAFVEQVADEGKTPKTRLDWSAEFKDEVLARLLALNAARAAAERAVGLTAAEEEDDEDDIDDGDIDEEGEAE